MTTTTARPPGVADAPREALIRAGHDPLAFCEFCDQPTAGVLADCSDPECVRKSLGGDRYFVRLDDR